MTFPQQSVRVIFILTHPWLCLALSWGNRTPKASAFPSYHVECNNKLLLNFLKYVLKEVLHSQRSLCTGQAQVLIFKGRHIKFLKVIKVLCYFNFFFKGLNGIYLFLSSILPKCNVKTP